MIGGALWERVKGGWKKLCSDSNGAPIGGTAAEYGDCCWDLEKECWGLVRRLPLGFGDLIVVR